MDGAAAGAAVGATVAVMVMAVVTDTGCAADTATALERADMRMAQSVAATAVEQ
jgi:hypothetical protein